jgi:hypothetical protein
VSVTRGGAGVDSAWEQENSKPEKCLKMATNPQRPVHAVLGRIEMKMATIHGNSVLAS